MPNHCGNLLIINGNKNERERLLKEMWVTKTGFSNYLNLDLLIPSEEHWKDWGTKWGCYDVGIFSCDDNTTRITFLTAWNEYNTNVQKAIMKKYPLLDFELLFAERGGLFCGSYKSKLSWQTFYEIINQFQLLNLLKKMMPLPPHILKNIFIYFQTNFLNDIIDNFEVTREKLEYISLNNDDDFKLLIPSQEKYQIPHNMSG
jgi:hypothetical protein